MPKPIMSHKVFYPRTTKANILRPLFVKWHSLLSTATARLSACKHKDLPYWHGERSHVGWLSLAAYEMGWLPIQEPTVPRRGTRDGRTDLWIYAGRSNKTKIYDFEAKNEELNLTRLKKPSTFYRRSYIKTNLNKAIRQLKKPRDYQGDVAVALVFIILYGDKGASIQEQRSSIKRFKKAATSMLVLKQAGADFVALFLAPDSCIEAASKAAGLGPHFGVAVLGKRAW